MRIRKWFKGLTAMAAVAVLAGGFAACDGSLLDVDDPDNVQPAEELEPGAVPARFAGVVQDFREAFDDYTLYAGMLTDEYILAGTFPTRLEVDERRPISDNTSINADLWEPMSTARATADQIVVDFQAKLDDPEFESQVPQMQQGIALGKLYGGYARIFFAELFCQSIFGGQEGLPNIGNQTPESRPRTSVERMQEAITILEEAEAAAATAGDEQMRLAALVGQGRAHLFLGNYQQAADVVSEVPDDFVWTVEYSTNTLAEENEVFNLTWGVNASLRWTVGGGDDPSRGNEEYAYLGAPADTTTDPDTPASGWIGQGLVVPPDISQGPLDKTSFNNATPVRLQTEYAGHDGNNGAPASIPLASGWEARMIEAENQIRNGGFATAETNVNDLLDDPEQQRNPIAIVQPSLTEPPAASDPVQHEMGAFDTVDFTGDLQNDLLELAYARAAGLWQSGQRQGTLRRFAVEFSDRSALGLYPNRTGDAISLPVPAQEVDNNSNISNACPAGLP